MEKPLFVIGSALVCLGDLALFAYSLIEGWMGWYKMYDRFLHVFWACVAVMALGALLLFTSYLVERFSRRY